MRVTVVLPAYNEEENLGHLLQKFKDVAEDIYNLQLNIIVVNDGSTDNTSAVAKSFGDSLKVEVIENEKNLGLADTFMRGMIIASEQAHEDDVILCMDADNSHSPGLALRMVRARFATEGSASFADGVTASGASECRTTPRATSPPELVAVELANERVSPAAAKVPLIATGAARRGTITPATKH